MIRKSPKNHWGFAPGKHIACARAFSRCTTQTPDYGGRLGGGLNSFVRRGWRRASVCGYRRCRSALNNRHQPQRKGFAPRSPSRLAGSMSALKRRYPAMAQPRHRFLGGISDSFSERERQRAGPGFVTPLLHAPNRIFPDRRMDKGST